LLFDLFPDVRDVAGPPGGVFLQTGPEQIADASRRLDGQGLPVRLASQHSRDRVLVGVAAEDAAAG